MYISILWEIYLILIKLYIWLTLALQQEKSQFMDNVFYLVSAHTSCIEGIRLSIKNKHVYITQDIVGFSADEEDSAG